MLCYLEVAYICYLEVTYIGQKSNPIIGVNIFLSELSILFY